MRNFVSDKCSFYVVYFSGLKYPLSTDDTDETEKAVGSKIKGQPVVIKKSCSVSSWTNEDIATKSYTNIS